MFSLKLYLMWSVSMLNPCIFSGDARSKTVQPWLWCLLACLPCSVNLKISIIVNLSLSEVNSSEPLYTYSSMEVCRSTRTCKLEHVMANQRWWETVHLCVSEFTIFLAFQQRLRECTPLRIGPGMGPYT